MKTSINPNFAIIKPRNIADNLPETVNPESFAEILPENIVPEDNISDNLPDPIKPEEMKGYINPEDIAEECGDSSEWLSDQIVEFIKSDAYKNLPPRPINSDLLSNPKIKELKERLGLNID